MTTSSATSATRGLQYLVGRSVSDLAAERGTPVLDTIFDLAVEANLDIGFARHTVPVATAEQRALRRRVLRDPRLVLGASDGGAHVRGVINAEYSTASFAELVRDDDVFTVEELVQEFTDVPARLYGLTDRGRIEAGAHADVVVFDPETINTSPVSLRHDLPGGATRLFSRGRGDRRRARRRHDRRTRRRVHRRPPRSPAALGSRHVHPRPGPPSLDRGHRSG